MADEVKPQEVKEPDKKSFGLKPNESNLIRSEMERHNVAMASLMSFIAVERLAYPVGQQTIFSLSGDQKELVIWENEPPAASLDKPVDLGDNSTDTAKALKK